MVRSGLVGYGGVWSGKIPPGIPLLLNGEAVSRTKVGELGMVWYGKVRWGAVWCGPVRKDSSGNPASRKRSGLPDESLGCGTVRFGKVR
jgi:hypothetical protein